MKKSLEVVPAACASCGRKETKLVKGDVIYAHRPDLFDLNFWLCVCGAYCGCHKTKKGDYKRPLGRTANKQLRGARSHCHKIFDPIWKSAPDLPCYSESEKTTKSRTIIQRAARRRTYAFMAEQMDMTEEECHIGMMDLNECRAFYRICRGVTAQQVRDWFKSK